MSGVERTVRLGLMSYIDDEGRHRSADCGATIHVHPDHLARFDRLNVLSGQEPAPVEPAEAGPEKAEPKPRTTRARKES